MLVRQKKRQFKKSEKGMALIESIPVLFLMVLLFNFSLGFFGAIHSGVLNSIGSYNYAIETFRFRSNLMYFRPGSGINYVIAKNRVHGVVKDGTEQTGAEEKSKWPATVRNITFNGRNPTSDGLNEEDKRKYGNRNEQSNIWKTAEQDFVPDESVSIVTPKVWVKTLYGICIYADCGE